MATERRDPQTWLVRHGETEWSRLGRHTGRTDIPLTDDGRDQARSLGRRLAGRQFASVMTSPLVRAAETASLAGFGDVVTEDADLQEWDYGAFEGRRSIDIQVDYPGWSIWTGPWPEGETVNGIGRRADQVIERIRAIDGDVLVFAHGHLLRVLAARWLDLPASAGGGLMLGTATLSVVGWDRGKPVIETWNEACHLGS